MKEDHTEKIYTLREACELLSVSVATGRNWLKSGRLTADSVLNHKPAFSKASLCAFQEALSSGTLPGLKARRNKSCLSGKLSCTSYLPKESPNHAVITLLLKNLEQEEVTSQDILLYGMLRVCAEQLILSSGSQTFLYEPLLNALMPPKEFALFQQQYCCFLSGISYTYLKPEDTLGCLYQSLCSIRERKLSGSYYTPTRLAKRLIAGLLPQIDCTQKILDPSCGTGIFLLHLPDYIPLENIHGIDINPVSVLLTRLNLALKYQITTPEEFEILQKNITVANFLETSDTEYDIILGNPPWGAKLSSEARTRYRNLFFCASGASVETFDLFTEQSLNLLSARGILSFVLPEALLTVKNHRNIRELLLKNTSVRSIEYLGEAFEHVHCPSILLNMVKTAKQPFFKKVNVTLQDGTSFSTSVEHAFSADCFSFSMTDVEYLLLEKLISCPNCTTLVDKSEFALGIVTGNNTAMLHSSPAPDLEPVITGRDIHKYHIDSPSSYLKFIPQQFQQTAPEHLYRAPEKLFYRFINRELLFAYDSSGLLSLNSCNILIPNIPGLPVKYILAILNSSIAQFIYEKKFHSIKVLRSHIEQLPIPLADKSAQQNIVYLVEQLMYLEKGSTDFREILQILDKKIADLFELSPEEYALINHKF